MKKLLFSSLAIVFAIATIMLIDLQNSSAKVVDGVGFHGQVRNSDGSWAADGAVTVRATFRENSTVVGTVYVGQPRYNDLLGSYNILQDESSWPYGSYEILAWDAAGHVGMTIVNFNGQPTPVPTITLSKSSIY
jgi:hypothetical protein